VLIYEKKKSSVFIMLNWSSKEGIGINKFENFFKHRNEIMHGGENSHFDKNLSTIALLFLGIVYSSLTAKNN